MPFGASTNFLRIQHGHEHSRVTFVELFFDLVFVFAVTQLSHTLLEHLTILGLAQTLILFLAVWWAWIDTAWTTNWLDPQRTPVRVMLFALMLAGLILSTSSASVRIARPGLRRRLCRHAGRPLPVRDVEPAPAQSGQLP
jgi:low temperature requirement protein LtrA